MESSSENSFTWADTASDSSDSHSMVVDASVLTKNTVSDRHGLKNKTKNMSSTSNGTADVNDTKLGEKIEEDQFYYKTQNNDSSKNKMVKKEPESDIDVPRKKKKIKNGDVNGNIKETQDTSSYDESYLNFKVKEEEMSATKKKKKKRKLSTMNEDALTDEIVYQRHSTDADELNTYDKAKEPEGDSNIPRKKKIKNSDNVNGKINETQDTVSYDEAYLNFKVKEEEVSSSLQTKKKKKKRKLSTMNENASADEIVHQRDSTDADEFNTSLNIEYDAGHSKSKKKKKKSKKRSDSEGQGDIDVKMDIDETVIDSKSTSRTAETSLKDNTMDETGCDEISAIQCEDDRDLHTISFDDGKFVQNECKRSNSLYKSTITNQFKMDQHNVDHDACVLSASEKRRTRISDRIRFEDEDDSETEFKQIHEKRVDQVSTKLKKYVKTMNLRVTSHKLQQSSVLTSEDEIWIIKCPKDIDVHTFNGSDLNIQDKCKIKVGGQTYDGSLEDEQCDTTLAALSMDHSKYEIVNLTLSGIINIRKRIPKAHFRDDNVMVNNQTNFIPLPETKCRHPLFGSNYKKALKIPSAVAERLNPQNREEVPFIIEKKKKKKHKKDRSQQEYEETDAKSEVRYVKPEPDLTVQLTETKKKKRKHADDDGPAPKKVKRIKHDPDSAEVWDSENAIGQNLFNL